MNKTAIKNFVKKIPFATSIYRALIKIFLYRRYLRDWRKFNNLVKESGKSRFFVAWKDRCVCLYENTGKTNFDRHYVYHPAWAARIVVSKIKPDLHVDISSSLHFCSILSATVPVEFYDYRPAELNLSGLKSAHADLCALPFDDNSVYSLSCMHVIEHIGLGRYGDPMDPSGDLKSISEIKRVLAVGGNFLFVVPMGHEAKICYNGHRIYTYEQISDYFKDLELVDFSLIPEDEKDGGLVSFPPQQLLEKQNYACGCFWFRKPQ